MVEVGYVVALGTVLANGAIAWAATKRLESIAEKHDGRIRDCEISIAKLEVQRHD